MKTRFLISSAITLAGLLASCSDLEMSTSSDFLQNMRVIGEDVQFEEPITRTSYASNLAFSWSLGDTLGIYPIGADQVSFPISSGEGSKSADFDGGAWALRSTYQYAGYFPFSANNYHNSMEAIPFSYEGQKQNGSNDMTQLGKFDYMSSVATTPTASGSVSLQMKRLGCFMRLSLTIPTASTLTEVKVESKGVQFGTEGTIDLTSSVPKLNVTKTSPSVKMALENLTTSTTNENVLLWMLTSPVDMSSETLTVSVTASNGDVFSGEVAGKKMVANGGYGYTVVLTKKGTGAEGEDPDIDFGDDTTPYLTFKADATQTLKMSKAVATLEYSVNNGAWAELGTNTVTFGGSNGDLRLRGKSSIGTSLLEDILQSDEYSTVCPRIVFGNTTKVQCNGDIRTLVNYEDYENANTSNARFAYLFFDCKSLTSAPQLPSTSVIDWCYTGMFTNCTSLTTAPALPAAKVDENCYDGMFHYCTSLTAGPDILPAMTLAKGCYAGMFEGCTSLVSAPVLPAETLASACYMFMFCECSSLSQAPALPATTLADYCYNHMFCRTAITVAPELPAFVLEDYCYMSMFEGCANLSEITMLATDLAGSEPLTNFFSSYAPTGTIYLNSLYPFSASFYIPEEWNVVYVNAGSSYTYIKHGYVDLGIKDEQGHTVYWATCNVGATSPEEYGGYYAWGETETKTEYSQSSYQYYKQFHGYDDIGSYIGGTDYDVASTKWGGLWRMPKYAEWNALQYNCTWTQTTLNDINGYKVEGVNGNWIFLPEAGYYNGTELKEEGVTGWYWMHSLYNTNLAEYMYFNNSGTIDGDDDGCCRYYGCSVRPVFVPYK